MANKKSINMVFPSKEDANNFMSWAYHYGYLEFQGWLEDSNSKMIKMDFDWDNYKIIVEEDDDNCNLINFENK